MKSYTSARDFFGLILNRTMRLSKDGKSLKLDVSCSSAYMGEPAIELSFRNGKDSYIAQSAHDGEIGISGALKESEEYSRATGTMHIYTNRLLDVVGAHKKDKCNFTLHLAKKKDETIDSGAENLEGMVDGFPPSDEQDEPFDDYELLRQADLDLDLD